jgi:hypothetical protein
MVHRLVLTGVISRFASVHYSEWELSMMQARNDPHWKTKMFHDMMSFSHKMIKSTKGNTEPIYAKQQISLITTNLWK